MATKAHKLLTGTDLHESKGVSTALAGQVYVTDGAGSGVWTTINTGIQFSTGDVKFTFKTTPDAGWLIPVDGQTLGNDTSGATYASTSLYSALYTLIWNNVSNTYAAVSGGRGGSAAADFAAAKKMTFPPWMSRVIGAAGAGTGLTTRGLGSNTGVETLSLITANLPPYTPAGSVVTSSTATVSGVPAWGGTTVVAAPPGSGGNAPAGGTVGSIIVNSSSAFTGTAGGGTSTAFSLIQPTVFLNLMIKY